MHLKKDIEITNWLFLLFLTAFSHWNRPPFLYKKFLKALPTGTAILHLAPIHEGLSLIYGFPSINPIVILYQNNFGDPQTQNLNLIWILTFAIDMLIVNSYTQ